MSEAYIYLVAGPMFVMLGFEPGAYIHIAAFRSSLAAVKFSAKSASTEVDQIS